MWIRTGSGFCRDGEVNGKIVRTDIKVRMINLECDGSTEHGKGRA